MPLVVPRACTIVMPPVTLAPSAKGTELMKSALSGLLKPTFFIEWGHPSIITQPFRPLLNQFSKWVGTAHALNQPVSWRGTSWLPNFPQLALLIGQKMPPPRLIPNLLGHPHWDQIM